MSTPAPKSTMLTTDALKEFFVSFDDLTDFVGLLRKECAPGKNKLLAGSEFGDRCSSILAKVHAFAVTVTELKEIAVMADSRLSKLESRVESTLEDQLISKRVTEMVEEVYDRVEDTIGLEGDDIMNEVQRNVLRMETDSLATRLVLTGVPESVEDLPTVFQRVCALLKVVVPVSDLVRAERMGRPRSGSPRAILIILSNQRAADLVLFSKRRKGRMSKTEIDASWGDGMISIGRRIGPFLQYLKKMLMMRIPTISSKAVWFANGVLLIRVPGVERPFAVRCYADIRELWKMPIKW